MKEAAEAPGFAEVVRLLEGGVGRAFPAGALYCARDGHGTLSIAVGEADLETWFDLASLTKALCTSVLCMRLVEAGRLDLAEEVLPGVSVRALLSHTSGLPAWRALYAEVCPGRDLTEVPSREARALVSAAAAATGREKAGERAVYSDLGFILLGDFLERKLAARLDVAFAEFAAALGADVGFRPLDSAAQAVPASRCAKTRRESAARELLSGVVHDDNARAMLGVAGHAGLFGTAAGVARVAAALLDAYVGAQTAGQRALGLSSETVQRFFALPSGPQLATFGLGWDHPNGESVATAAPSSAGRLWPRNGVGHLGYTGCSLWLDLTSRTICVLLTNRVCAPTPAQATAAQAELKALRPALHDAVLRAYGRYITPGESLGPIH